MCLDVCIMNACTLSARVCIRVFVRARVVIVVQV